VSKHINEVVPGRISFINKKLLAINYNFQSYINGKNLLSLSDIYFLLPISKEIEKNRNIQYYFSLLESILKTKTINPKMLITKFSESIKLIFYENTESYSLSKKYRSPELSNYVLRTNIFYKFLREINNINEVSDMVERKTSELLELIENRILFLEKNKNSDTSDSDVQEKKNKGKTITISNLKKLSEYLKDFQNIVNQEQKLSLILLGYLMGEVAKKQKSSGLANKPILKKVNFSGLNKKDIIKLSNEVYDKLIKYKISDYNEIILYAKDKILSLNIENWNLSKEENLYFIMSGYSVSQIWIENKEDNNGN
jgi:CRISPR-associated protein Csh1